MTIKKIQKLSSTHVNSLSQYSSQSSQDWKKLQEKDINSSLLKINPKEHKKKWSKREMAGLPRSSYTGNRSVTDLKFYPTIWDPILKLCNKYLLVVINSCKEKCNENILSASLTFNTLLPNLLKCNLANNHIQAITKLFTKLNYIYALGF